MWTTEEMSDFLAEEIDWLEPEAAFMRLVHMPGLAFLDSAAQDSERGSRSYICLDPIEEIRLEQPSMPEAIHALKKMTRCVGETRSREGPLPFVGGLVGMMSYETGLTGHGLVSRHAQDADIPAFIVRRYDLVIGFDLGVKRAWIFASDRQEVLVAQRIIHLKRSLAQPPADSGSGSVSLPWRELTPYPEYAARIEAVKKLIVDGDIYQANISTRFEARRPPIFSEADAYLKLRAISPAPFSAFLDMGGGCFLLSASPERFLSVASDGRIETRPIKGTSPRYRDPHKDMRSGAALDASEKDRAENLMICDLLRNDISMVSMPGSVQVPQLAGLEKFASVWHLVSVVTARLARDKSAIDLLEATMPGGSITGAPKRRAMEIIDSLEDTPRGPNFGCLFWIGDDGAMDSSIIIRSLVTTPKRIIAQAGGGIVADSSAEGEYAELKTKIAPLLAVGKA